MHEKLGAAIIIAAALVGCAQILGIEDLPPLSDAGAPPSVIP